MVTGRRTYAACDASDTLRLVDLGVTISMWALKKEGPGFDPDKNKFFKIDSALGLLDSAPKAITTQVLMIKEFL